MDTSGIDWGSVAGDALGAGFSLFNMFSGSPYSTRGQTQQAAALADPFASSRGMIQGQLPGALGAMEGTPAALTLPQAMSAASGYSKLPEITQSLWRSAGGATANPAIGSAAGDAGSSLQPLLQMAGGSSLIPSLSALTTSDPSVGFRYQTGLDSLNRAAAQTGTIGSGKQMLDAERYGQEFASTEYQSQFSRDTQLQSILQGLQAQNFGQVAGADQLSMEQAGQRFQQLLGSGQYGLQVQGQNVQQLLGLNNMSINESEMQFNNLLAGAQLANTMQNQRFSGASNIAELLGKLASGGSSPSTAGQIASGQIGAAQAQLGASLGAGSSDFGAGSIIQDAIDIGGMLGL